MGKGWGIFQELFHDRVFYNKLFKIAIPIIIQNFIGSFLNMIDTVMIGRIGETEIAAVGIANQYFFFFTLIAMSIYSGCSIFISQFWGKGDIKSIRKVMGMGLISGVICASVFVAAGIAVPERIIGLFNRDPQVIELGARYMRIVLFSYVFTSITFSYSFALRSIGKTVLPMVVGAIALLFNTFLNYALIFGNFGAPAMGVEGAALATLIARIIETAILIAYIYSKGGVLAAGLREMTDITFEFVKRSYRIIIPVMLNEACWGLGFMVYSAAYGRIGTQAMASIQICSTILNLFMVVIFGMANASSVMIGNRIGAGEEELGMDYARRFSLLGVFEGVLVGAVLALSAPYMLSFFNVSQMVLHDSLIILYITSAIMVVRVFDIILIVGVLRGGGDAKCAFLIEAFTMWGIGVPMVFFGAFYLKLPVYGVFALLTLEEVAKCILCLARLRSGKWVKNVIYDMA